MAEIIFTKNHFYLLLSNYLLTETEKRPGTAYAKECEIARNAVNHLISIAHKEFPDEQVEVQNPKVFGSAKIWNKERPKY